MKFKGLTKTGLGDALTSIGCVYLVLALMVEASPQFGGAFSILIMAGDLLANIPKLTGIASTAAKATTATSTGAETSAVASTATSAASETAAAGTQAATDAGTAATQTTGDEAAIGAVAGEVLPDVF
jgi:hypothetical protein